MSISKPILAVFGATGLQGGSVIQHFLTHPSNPYTLRALTRDPSSAKSQDLAAKGTEVVRADLDDENSLYPALTGTTAVFLVTDFWAKPDEVGYETEQMKRVLRVLSTISTLKHLVFSTLPSITLASDGTVTGVRHFDGKAEATKWLMSEEPELWKKTTALWVGIYFQAWKLFPLAPKKTEGGVYVQAMAADPETTIPTVDVRDTGNVVGSILVQGEDMEGKVVKMVRDMPISVMLSTWSDITSKPTYFHKLSDEEGQAGIEQLGLKGYRASSLVDLPRALRGFEGAIYSGKSVSDGVEVVDAKDMVKLRNWQEFVQGEDWEKVFDGTGYHEMTAEY